jgi:hypothetical protein
MPAEKNPEKNFCKKFSPKYFLNNTSFEPKKPIYLKRLCVFSCRIGHVGENFSC